MCGIVGVVDRHKRPVNAEIVRAMNDRIVHRGPDDEGYYVSGAAAFGFRRLAIIDLVSGHQPLANEDESVWIVFNGEIYNYKELRRGLIERGHVFKSESDTEVIVHLYEEYGPECVKHLRGMFAFGIWDAKQEQLFLARDPFGIKPLYYSVTDDHVAFASEIKAILPVPGVSREIDRESFWNYLTFQYVPEPRTMFADVAKLPPAHYMLLKDGVLRRERYYRLEFAAGNETIEEYARGTIERLRESVRAHMASDVPRGAFLSSGVDSSAIVALLKELEEVQTFTVGFEGAGGLNEIASARETARLLGTTHRDVVISATTYWNELPRLIFHQDEPVADPSAIALYFVSELASEYVTVVLSGEGADEIFGGYTIYREPLSLALFEFMPPSMRRALGETAKLLPEGMKGRSFLLRGSKPLEERFFGNAFLFGDREKERFVFIRPDREGMKRPTDITRQFYDEAAGLDPVTRMQYLDLHTWLPGDILMKADKMTMANSVELRVPFLDKYVFEYAARVPARYRLQNGTTKQVLREAVRELLPREVTERPKLGFPVPTRRWLRDEHYLAVKELIADSPCDDLFDKRYVLQMLEEHRLGTRDNARKIWAIVVFLIWHQIYVKESVTFTSKESERVSMRRQRMFAHVGA